MTDCFLKLREVEQAFYEQAKIILNQFKTQHESSEYYGHTASLDGNPVLYRVAKRTPTKTGFFVTLWKRDGFDKTVPYDSEDDFCFVIISTCFGEHFGQFIFPKKALIEQNIFSSNNIGGKRGFRLYTPWDCLESPQAKKTAQWQQKFFINLKGPRGQISSLLHRHFES